jgi:adenine deaminase
MDEVVPTLRDLPDTRLVMLVTDLAPLDGLAQKGAMNPLLQKAVALGVKPARAVAWCSLNPALYFGLRRLGGIAPGNWADFWLSSDLEEFKAKKVYLAGQCVAENGVPFALDTRFAYTDMARGTMQGKRPQAGDFAMPSRKRTVKARVLRIVSSTITKEACHELIVENGAVKADPGRDILKMGVYNRHGSASLPALGFVEGWGLKNGALATSLLWDTNNLLVIGASDQEMALAAGRVHELGGGTVVTKGSEIMAQHAMPIAGIISDKNLDQIVREHGDCENALRSLGCGLVNPLLTAQTLCFTGLPFLRLTDKGLVDIKNRTTLEVFL